MPHTNEVSWWNRMTNAVNSGPSTKLGASQWIVDSGERVATGSVIANESAHPEPVEGQVTKDSYQGPGRCKNLLDCLVQKFGSSLWVSLAAAFGGLDFLPVKEKRVIVLSQTGDNLGAIDLQKDIARQYAKMGEHWEAANAFSILGRLQMKTVTTEAADSFNKAGDHFEAINDRYRAVDAYKSAGDALAVMGADKSAGKAYLKTADFAARHNFDPAYLYLLAGQSFEKGGNFLSAADSFERAALKLADSRESYLIVEAGAARIRRGDMLRMASEAYAGDRLRKEYSPKRIEDEYREAARLIATVTDDYNKRVQLKSEQLHRALYLRGDALEKAGLKEEAARAYIRLYEWHPDTTSDGWRMTDIARYKAAALLAGLGRHEDAAGILRTMAGDPKNRSVSDLPLLGEVRLELGRVLKDGGFYFEARTALAEAIMILGDAARYYEEQKSGESKKGMARYLRGVQDEASHLLDAIKEEMRFKDINRIIDEVAARKEGAMAELATVIGVDEQKLIYDLRDRKGRTYELLGRIIGPQHLSYLADVVFPPTFGPQRPANFPTDALPPDRGTAAGVASVLDSLEGGRPVTREELSVREGVASGADGGLPTGDNRGGELRDQEARKALEEAGRARDAAKKAARDAGRAKKK